MPKSSQNGTLHDDEIELQLLSPPSSMVPPGKLAASATQAPAEINSSSIRPREGDVIQTFERSAMVSKALVTLREVFEQVNEPGERSVDGEQRKTLRSWLDQAQVDIDSLHPSFPDAGRNEIGSRQRAYSPAIDNCLSTLAAKSEDTIIRQAAETVSQWMRTKIIEDATVRKAEEDARLRKEEAEVNARQVAAIWEAPWWS